MRFFSPNASIAVLPPIALSAWASRVVGTWMTGQPRLNRMAASPARSPTEPPPSATIGVSRLALRAARSPSRRWRTSQSLAASPSGTRIGSARRARSATGSPWRAKTRGSLTRIGAAPLREVGDLLDRGLDRPDEHVIADAPASTRMTRHSPRCSRSAATIASTTSPCAPSPLRTWMCGLGVERAALLGEPGQRFGAVAVAQQRAGVAAAGALGQHVDRRVEPDGDRALVEQLARARVDEGAAAGGDDPDLALDQPGDQAPLAVAEILLAIALEHFGGRSAADGSSIANRCRRTAGRAAWPGAGRRSICRRPSGRQARSAGRGGLGIRQLFHERGYT